MGPGVATAKIANFSLSRKFHDFSKPFDSEKKKFEMDRWTAPEKLKKTAYSVQCEVFRLIKEILLIVQLIFIHSFNLLIYQFK